MSVVFSWHDRMIVLLALLLYDGDIEFVCTVYPEYVHLHCLYKIIPAMYVALL